MSYVKLQRNIRKDAEGDGTKYLRPVPGQNLNRYVQKASRMGGATSASSVRQSGQQQRDIIKLRE